MQTANKLETVKGPKILARSFFKELRENGYDAKQILAISTELIDLVTQELRGEEVPAESSKVVELRSSL